MRVVFDLWDPLTGSTPFPMLVDIPDYNKNWQAAQRGRSRFRPKFFEI
jgi:hypothetical protein